jgi:hypothetical protein
LPPASDGRQETLAQANELSRSFAALLDSFNRHRGKGQQKGTVENVHLQAGGQAGSSSDRKVGTRNSSCFEPIWPKVDGALRGRP